jgi:hypothetical protein
MSKKKVLVDVGVGFEKIRRRNSQPKIVLSSRQDTDTKERIMTGMAMILCQHLQMLHVRCTSSVHETCLI